MTTVYNNSKWLIEQELKKYYFFITQLNLLNITINQTGHTYKSNK